MSGRKRNENNPKEIRAVNEEAVGGVNQRAVGKRRVDWGAIRTREINRECYARQRRMWRGPKKRNGADDERFRVPGNLKYKKVPKEKTTKVGPDRPLGEGVWKVILNGSKMQDESWRLKAGKKLVRT